MDADKTEKPDLQAMVAKWQPILRLQDWNIRIRSVRHFEMQGTGHQGEVTFISRHRLAYIDILNRCDLNPDVNDAKEDAEVTVVHELLHIHFALIDGDFEATRRDLYEQAIDAIANALVMTDRKGNRPPTPIVTLAAGTA